MLTTSALLLFTILQLSSGQHSCRDPKGDAGTCVSKQNCPAILSLLRKDTLLDEDIQFVQQSQCVDGNGLPPYVCCASRSGVSEDRTMSTDSKTVNSTPSNGEGNILPTLPRCGRAASGERIYNGNDTLLDEFAWMVLLEYVSNKDIRTLNCGGSLINQRYVLTAAHCVTGAVLEQFGRLDRVRLGEYDLSKDIDCNKVECADPIVNIGVEESIPHPQYDDFSLNKQNDIALVRLSSVVTYTDFIKPVCLPSALGTNRALASGANLIVAGWGRTHFYRQSKVKQKLYIPVFEFKECFKKFKDKGVQLTSKQLCAGGRFSEDSCDGDSGGPLMSEHDAMHYAVEGIVSFGHKCGLEGWPGVYTKVADFETWIRSILRP